MINLRFVYLEINSIVFRGTNSLRSVFRVLP